MQEGNEYLTMLQEKLKKQHYSSKCRLDNFQGMWRVAPNLALVIPPDEQA